MRFQWDGIVMSAGLVTVALFALTMVVVNYAFDAALADGAGALERVEGKVTVSHVERTAARSPSARIAASYEVAGLTLAGVLVWRGRHHLGSSNR